MSSPYLVCPVHTILLCSALLLSLSSSLLFSILLCSSLPVPLFSPLPVPLFSSLPVPLFSPLPVPLCSSTVSHLFHPASSGPIISLTFSLLLLSLSSVVGFLSHWLRQGVHRGHIRVELYDISKATFIKVWNLTYECLPLSCLALPCLAMPCLAIRLINFILCPTHLHFDISDIWPRPSFSFFSLLSCPLFPSIFFFSLQAHDADLAHIALNADGSRLGTASEKGTLIRLWDCHTGRVVRAG